MRKVLKKLGLLVCASVLVLSLASCGESEKNGSGNASTSTSKSEAAKNDNSANNKSNDNNSEGSSDGGNGGSSDSAPVAGETYDTGMFTVTVPSGWLAAPAYNFDGDNDPTIVNIIKGGNEELDMIDHAYIRINLFDKDTFVTAKDWYDDVKDMDPVTVSGFKCNAYSCTSYDYPYVMLEGANDVKDISFSLLLKSELSSFEYGDADVQTILNSVVVK